MSLLLIGIVVCARTGEQAKNARNADRRRLKSSVTRDFRAG